GGRIPISSEPGNTLMRKYDIRPEANNVGQADHLSLDLTLRTIWARAGIYFNNVANLLGL
ncbi:MAG TPA: hypothetical protein VJ302_11055, partial [Blastocatellia bacterium]|nr:hypothetical protein [Blastocatellia bacterium]